MKITNPRDFGQVAVVMGGDSAEREVSLDGGRQVLDALRRQDIAAFKVDGIPKLLDKIQEGGVDRVFNLLHGRGGEDGVLQGTLRSRRVPVTGCGLLGSALSMHKALSKRVWRDLGLPTAPFEVIASGPTAGQDAAAIAEAIGYPLVVKPVSEGSSVGVSIVRRSAELPAAVNLAGQHDSEIMLEAYVSGGEYTVAVLQGEPLPVVKIEPAREFYDYQAKYEDDDTRYLCPAGLDDQAEQDLRKLGLRAFLGLGCRGWGRVDFLGDQQGRFVLLEANTTPGMTSHSLVPKAAAAVGIEFDTLVWRILETSFEESA